MSAKFKKFRLFWGGISLLLVLTSQIAPAVENCDYANDLLFYAYYLHDKNSALSQQQLLFSRSLQFCPNQPKVHYILATILKQQGKYLKAIDHYQYSLKVYPDFYQTWYGLGEAYYKQKQFPLSVEAYSHICQMNSVAKAQIKNMLRNNRLSTIEEDQIIEPESLLVSYDTERRNALHQRLLDCGIATKIEPQFRFLNLSFDTRSVSLAPEIMHQFDDIATALKNTQFSQVIVYGNTDARGFKGLSVAESQQRNLQLSLERAKTVVNALVQRGIDKKYLKAEGHGSEHPIMSGFSPEALVKNRRTEIEVKPVETSPYQENIEGDK